MPASPTPVCPLRLHHANPVHRHGAACIPACRSCGTPCRSLHKSSPPSPAQRICAGCRYHKIPFLKRCLLCLSVCVTLWDWQNSPAPYALTLQKAKKLLSGMFSFFNKSYLHQFQNVKAHRLYIR